MSPERRQNILVIGFKPQDIVQTFHFKQKETKVQVEETRELDLIPGVLTPKSALPMPVATHTCTDAPAS